MTFFSPNLRGVARAPSPASSGIGGQKFKIYRAKRVSKAGFFFSSRRRHTRYIGDWSSDVCSSDLHARGRRVGGSAAAPSRARRRGVCSVGSGAAASGLSRGVCSGGSGAGASGLLVLTGTATVRSEERRVGKEGGSRAGSSH